MALLPLDRAKPETADDVVLRHWECKFRSHCGLPDRIGIREDSDENNSDFTDVLVLSARKIDDNGFHDSSEEAQAEQGGVEPYQYELKAETDSNSVSETRLEAGLLQ